MGKLPEGSFRVLGSGENTDDFIRLVRHSSTKQSAFNEREDGRVHTNRDRKCHDRHRTKSARFREQSKGQLHVAKYATEHLDRKTKCMTCRRAGSGGIIQRSRWFWKMRAPLEILRVTRRRR